MYSSFTDSTVSLGPESPWRRDVWEGVVRILRIRLKEQRLVSVTTDEVPRVSSSLELNDFE